MLSDYYIHCRQYVKCINGKSLTSQRVQLSPPTDRLPHPVLSPSSGRSAPLDKKTFKCVDISHGKSISTSDWAKTQEDDFGTFQRGSQPGTLSQAHFWKSWYFKTPVCTFALVHLRVVAPKRRVEWLKSSTLFVALFEFLSVMVIVREVMLTHMTYDIYDQSHWHTMVGFETL